jgi:alpha-L-fucosidase
MGDNGDVHDILKCRGCAGSDVCEFGIFKDAAGRGIYGGFLCFKMRSLVMAGKAGVVKRVAEKDRQAWFREAALGMFIHWGPYAMWGRGEQVLFRERVDQKEYAQKACAWDPKGFDPEAWARTAKEAGFKYAVLTTRHHDGYCLWDTRTTDYSSAAQKAGQDFVGPFVKAFRKAGLKVGLYYSLVDWRFPAYFEGPQNDPEGWHKFVAYCHAQVKELMSNYGKIDVFWFDGNWPSAAQAWRARELVGEIRKLQPGILVNERLNTQPCAPGHEDLTLPADSGEDFGDFSTPEHHITADAKRIWESCNTTTWRLWGFTQGEQWRSAEELTDMICTAAERGGNILLNVGPDGQGRLPKAFSSRFKRIGAWLKTNGEAIYGTTPGDVCEFVTWGRQTVRGNNLYLICRFWHNGGTMTLGGLATKVKSATLLETGEKLAFTQTEDHLTINGLPKKKPGDLFPVIKLVCAGEPKPRAWAAQRVWTGNPRRMTDWAQARGQGGQVDGTWKENQ